VVRRRAILSAFVPLFLFALLSQDTDAQSAAKQKPAIDGFYPHCIAPDANGNYSFKILMRDFHSERKEGMEPALVLFNGADLGVKWVDTKPSDEEMAAEPDKTKHGEIKGFISANDREIQVWGLPKTKWLGPISVKVETTGSEHGVSDAAELRLAYVSDITAKMIAIAVAMMVFLIPILCVGNKRSTYTIAGKKLSLFSAFLLDAESNTYSLSKLQFYLWTFAGVFGYVFLTLARSLVQGRFEFADLPENLPGIIFVSGATTVIAAGTTALKGPKGAGDEQPGLADFVTAGGVVVSERFQFLVWTLLGVGAFVFVILFADAASITTLPSIPQQFLMLMGVSSAGYLGGKLARKPGPVIDSILPTRAPAAPAVAVPIASLDLEIHGAALSKDASFKLDDNEVKFTRTIGPTSNPNPVVKADDFATSGFAQVLKLNINDLVQNPWLAPLSTGSHTLTIINPDGKLATWSFTL
jgi:hypothetical protein